MSECTRIAQCIKDEFKLSNFGLNTDSKLLVNPQWPCIRPPFYVTYRILVAILFPIWVIVDLVSETKYYFKNDMTFWLIYATNWGFLLLALSTIIHAVLCIVHHVYRPQGPIFEEGSTPWSLKLYWVIFNLASNSALVISLCYYIGLALFKQADFMATPSSFVKHTLNTIYVLFDLMLSATPVRLLHIVYVLILSMSYTIFNVIYYAAGGKDSHGLPIIYKVLDWSQPGKAIAAVFVEFAISIIVQILLWLYYHSRLFIHSKTFEADDSQSSATENSGILSSGASPSYDSVEERVHMDEELEDVPTTATPP